MGRQFFLLESALLLKEPTTYKEQILKLKGHGFVVDNEEQAIEFLKNVNYYRLSAYFLPFKRPNEVANDIPFSKLISIYRFDSRMRLWVLAVIEDIEQYAKTQIAYHIAHEYGAEAYLNEDIFSQKHKHKNFLSKLEDHKKENRKNPVLIHHNKRYKGRIPIWAIVEFFSIGSLSVFYADLKIRDRKYIAKNGFSTGQKQLVSWLRVTTELRNRCAHFARLYFWNFHSVPKSDKHNSKQMDNTLFSQIFMLKLLHPMKEEWNRHLKNLIDLIDEFSQEIDLDHIGFKTDWKSVLENPKVMYL